MGIKDLGTQILNSSPSYKNRQYYNFTELYGFGIRVIFIDTSCVIWNFKPGYTITPIQLLKQTFDILNAGIVPIYLFDGDKIKYKSETVQNRIEGGQKNEIKFQQKKMAYEQSIQMFQKFQTINQSVGQQVNSVNQIQQVNQVNQIHQVNQVNQINPISQPQNVQFTELKKTVETNYNELLKSGRSCKNFTNDDITKFQERLTCIGVPWYRIDGCEPEAVIGFGMKYGLCDAAISADTDIFMYTDNGVLLKDKKNGKYGTVDIGKVFREIGISRNEMINLGIILGNDFNIRLFGPSAAAEILTRWKIPIRNLIVNDLIPHRLNDEVSKAFIDKKFLAENPNSQDVNLIYENFKILPYIIWRDPSCLNKSLSIKKGKKIFYNATFDEIYELFNHKFLWSFLDTDRYKSMLEKFVSVITDIRQNGKPVKSIIKIPSTAIIRELIIDPLIKESEYIQSSYQERYIHVGETNAFSTSMQDSDLRKNIDRSMLKLINGINKYTGIDLIDYSVNMNTGSVSFAVETITDPDPDIGSEYDGTSFNPNK